MEKIVLIGKSMKPFYKEGTIAFYEKVPFEILKPMNVIVFKRKKKSKPVVHRIIKINYKKKNIITKGDNSKYFDRPVNYTNILGKVIARKKGKNIIIINRFKELFQFYFSNVYLFIKRIVYFFIYENSALFFSYGIDKLIFKKRNVSKKRQEFFLFNKKVAIINNEKHNYIWLHKMFAKDPYIIKEIIKVYHKKDSVYYMNIKKNPDVVFRSEGEEGLLYNPKTGEIKILNETACFIYSLLDKRNSKKDIVKKLINNYDVSENQAEKEVEDFLQNLENLP